MLGLWNKCKSSFPPTSRHWKEKWSHFDLKSESLEELKFDPGLENIWLKLTRYWESKLDIESKFDSNILQLLGIPGQILVPPVTQLFSSKWLHFFFQLSPFVRFRMGRKVKALFCYIGQTKPLTRKYLPNEVNRENTPTNLKKEKFCEAVAFKIDDRNKKKMETMIDLWFWVMLLTNWCHHISL